MGFMKRKTTEQFIIDAIAVHGDTYDYSNSEYIGSRSPITIGCEVHGDFTIIAYNHLSGRGCQKCGIETRSHSNSRQSHEFVSHAIHTHGAGRYTYDNVCYENSHTPVYIGCPVHGEFSQRPDHHLSGSGCPKCVGDRNGFISRATKLYGSEYEYEFINYYNSYTPIRLKCGHHGEFLVTPRNHLRGARCPSCNTICKTNKFIASSKAIHSGMYGYEHVIYENSKLGVKITCPNHGIFEQTPDAHLSGKGCPKCVSRKSKPANAWLDSLGIPDDPDHREVDNLIPHRKYAVDGYDPETKTVYEFHGDYWHGNPAVYESSDTNPSTKTTYGWLFQKTVTKKEKFVAHGFKYVEMWESDWKNKLATTIEDQIITTT